MSEYSHFTLLEASVVLCLGCTHNTNVGEDAASARRTVVVFAARLRVTHFRLYSTLSALVKVV